MRFMFQILINQEEKENFSSNLENEEEKENENSIFPRERERARSVFLKISRYSRLLPAVFWQTLTRVQMSPISRARQAVIQPDTAE